MFDVGVADVRATLQYTVDDTVLHISTPRKKELHRWVNDTSDCRQHFHVGSTGSALLGLAPRRWQRSRKWHPQRFQTLFMVEKWNLKNPQGNEWNLPYSQDTKIALQAKVLLR